MDLFTAADAVADASANTAAADAHSPTQPQGQPLTVANLTYALKHQLETHFKQVHVVGEISSFKRAGSGHVYFNLKDQEQDVVLAAVIWRSKAETLPHPLADGQLVVASGRVTLYPPRGQYQLDVQSVTPAGEGVLLQMFAARKAQFAAEGLFALDRKRPLPLLPRRVGLITSPTGAVLQDMLHRLRERCPRDVLLAPVRVQGDGAAQEIAAAIVACNTLPAAQRPDVLIVARGGGSLEDLWAFNEEILVRAVAASAIPIISGVGHEPDITLCDLAADVRAPTPTAAMEYAVPVRAEVLAALRQQHLRLQRYIAQQVQFKSQKLDLLHAKLPPAANVLQPLAQRLHHLHTTLTQQMSQRLATAQHRCALLSRVLPALAPLQPLARGFLYATAAGQPITSATTTATEIQLHFQDGTRHALLHPVLP